jgi:uncharacterized membrane protein YdcZ (DUF606 family)
MGWIAAQVFPREMTPIEVIFVGFALSGLFFTLCMVVYVGRAALVLRRAIHRGDASWEGPRWQFLGGMLAAMVLCVPAWGFFVTASLLAVRIPISPRQSAAELADNVGVCILAGEIFFWLVQVTILLMWRRTRRAPIFRYPSGPNQRGLPV